MCMVCMHVRVHALCKCVHVRARYAPSDRREWKNAFSSAVDSSARMPDVTIGLWFSAPCAAARTSTALPHAPNFGDAAANTMWEMWCSRHAPRHMTHGSSVVYSTAPSSRDAPVPATARCSVTTHDDTVARRWTSMRFTNTPQGNPSTQRPADLQRDDLRVASAIPSRVVGAFTNHATIQHYDGPDRDIVAALLSERQRALHKSRVLWHRTAQPALHATQAAAQLAVGTCGRASTRPHASKAHRGASHAASVVAAPWKNTTPTCQESCETECRSG